MNYSISKKLYSISSVFFLWLIILGCASTSAIKVAPNPTLVDEAGVSIAIDFNNYTISIRNRRTDHDIKVVVVVESGTSFWNLSTFPIYEKKVGKGKSYGPERINLRSGERFRIKIHILGKYLDRERKTPYINSYPAFSTLTVP